VIPFLARRRAERRLGPRDWHSVRLGREAAGTGPAAAPRRALRSRIGAAETLRRSLTVAWRNVMQIRHTPEKLLDVILMPAVFLVLFLYVFGGAVAGSIHAYLEQLLRGLVGMMAMFAPWAWAPACATTSARACSTGSAACR